MSTLQVSAPDRCRICLGPRVTSHATGFEVNLWRCNDCDARFVFPVPAASALGDRYETEHRAGKWKELFDQAPAAETERRATVLTEIKGGPGSLLDVGFGDGRYLDAAKQEGWDTWGMELSMTAAKSASLDHRVLVGGFSALGEDTRFDAITFWDVLEHVSDPGSMVRDAVRVLAPKGVVAVTMPNVRGTESIVFGSRWKYYDLDMYGHLFHLGADHLTRLLEGAGLRIDSIETRGSVDLRDLLGNVGRGPGVHAGRAVLDRLSGLLARIAVPLKRGNTLMVVGSRPDATGA